jgi:diphosphomevalonate decarboxylase
MRSVTAIAHANIALAKYWGKADEALNLPAVPSLSLTLEALRTVTTVTFTGAARGDELVLDGVAVTGGRPLERASALLDRVRAMAGLRSGARVESRNEFPTASGLASSASGFAALAVAASAAAGLDLTPTQLSRLARQSSASAARSMWGGYVALAARAHEAEPVAPWEHLPLVMLVALTTNGPKEISSTAGMKHTAETSPYYAGWLASAPRVFEEVRRAILEADLERLGAAVEHSALSMHASMLAARPAVRYFAPATLRVLDRLLDLRRAGRSAYATMDAGPHVKVLTSAGDADPVEAALRELPEVRSILRSRGGPAACVVAETVR